MEVVASLSQGRTAAAQCGLFTRKSVPVIFEPPCILLIVTAVIVCICVRTQRTLFVYFGKLSPHNIRFDNEGICCVLFTVYIDIIV